MKESERVALGVIQREHFEAVRKQNLYAHMLDEIQRQIRDAVPLVLEINKAHAPLGERLAHLHDRISQIIAEDDR